LNHLPSASFEINQAWLLAVAMACDLLAWLRLLCLSGDLALAEPKTLRYRLLHTAAAWSRPTPPNHPDPRHLARGQRPAHLPDRRTQPPPPS
jgi:hypothetical protein